MTNINIAAVSALTCPRCGATPGQVCVTRSGRRASYTHTPRVEPLRRMWVKGYEDGMREVLDHAWRVSVLDRLPTWLQRFAQAKGVSV